MQNKTWYILLFVDINDAVQKGQPWGTLSDDDGNGNEKFTQKKRIRTVWNLIALIPTLPVSLAYVSRTTIYYFSDFFLSRRRPFSVSSLIL